MGFNTRLIDATVGIVEELVISGLRAYKSATSGGAPVVTVDNGAGGSAHVTVNGQVTGASLKAGSPATTPATGDLVAAGKVVAEGNEFRGSNSNIKLEIKKITLTNNAAARLPNVDGGAAGSAGIAFVIGDNTGAGIGVYALNGGFAATNELQDPSGVYSPTAGTASSTNIYYSGGNNRYEIENKTGNTQNYSIFLLTS